MCCMSHQRQAQWNKQMWKSQTKQQMQLPRIHQDVAQLHSHSGWAADMCMCVCVRLSFSYNFTRLVVTATCLFRLSFSVCVCVCVASHASSSFHSTCQPRSAMQNGHQATNELPDCQCERLPCSRLAISDNNTHLFSWLLPHHALPRVTKVMHCRVLLLYHL